MGRSGLRVGRSSVSSSRREAFAGRSAVASWPAEIGQRKPRPWGRLPACLCCGADDQQVIDRLRKHPWPWPHQLDSGNCLLLLCVAHWHIVPGTAEGCKSGGRYAFAFVPLRGPSCDADSSTLAAANAMGPTSGRAATGTARCRLRPRRGGSQGTRRRRRPSAQRCSAPARAAAAPTAV